MTSNHLSHDGARRIAFFRVAAAGLALLGGFAASTGADTLVVLNKSEASASLIDLDSGEEVARVATGEGPHEVAVSPDGRTAVVGNYGTRENPGKSLTVIEVESARAVKTIDLGDYSRPHGIEFFGDGKRVAVTAEAQKALIVVDVAEGAVVQAVETAQDVSHMVALTPDEQRAFVANIGSGSISVIDLGTGERIANVRTGDGAEGICVTPDGRHVWVTNRGADSVSVVDAQTLEVVKTLPSASFPIRAKATPDGKWVLVTNARSDELAVFDAGKMEEHRRIKMALKAEDASGRLFGDAFGESSVPIGVLVSPDGARAYVAHANSDVISIVDLNTWEIAGHVRGGKEPDGLGYSARDVRP